MKGLLLLGAWVASLAALATGSRLVIALTVLAAVAGPVAVYRSRRAGFLSLAALGVVLLAGVRWQGATAPPPADSVAWAADGERHIVEGRIRRPPEERGATQRFEVQVTALDAGPGSTSVSGAVLVRVAVARSYREGDLVRLDGRLEPPPALSEFDYRAYLARRDVFAVMEYPRVRVVGRDGGGAVAGWLGGLRGRAHAALWRGLPATEAALADGILTGRRGEIPRDVYDDFSAAGVSHLIVISGFNIALLAGLVVSASAWLVGRRRAGLLALLAIALYSVFVGLTPPVARAAVMGGVAVLAMLAGRPSSGGPALLFAAALLTLRDPRALQDVSFQLSFAACAGLLVLSPPLIDLGRRWMAETEAAEGPSWRSLAFAAWETLAVTLAATAAALPMLLVNFERLSLVSPLANLLLVPLFPLVLLTGVLGLLVAVPWPAGAEVALLPLRGLLEFAVVVAQVCARLPGASVTVRGFGPLQAAAVYAAMLGIVAWRSRAGRREADEGLHRPAPLLARPLPFLALTPAALLLLAAVMVFARRPGPDDRSHVRAWELPGAPAALVTLPGGGRVLVDTGLSPAAGRAALDRVSPASGPRLDAVVISGDLPSTTGGLAAILARYETGLLLVPPAAIEAAPGWLEAARATGVPVEPLREGMSIRAGAGALTVRPDRDQAGRWTVRLRHGERELSVRGGTGDGVVRDGRRTAISVTMERGRLRLPLAAAGSAVLTTDGRSVWLRGPRGRAAELHLCAPRCEAAGR